MFGVKGKMDWEGSTLIRFVLCSESFRELGLLNESQLWVMNQKATSYQANQ